MFKSLLRTIPTLSGNYTLSCKINELIQLNSNDYEVYIRHASLVPLQNSIFNANISVNLVKDQHEHIITKYFNKYSNIFYKENYSYDKNNYRDYDEYEINRTNDSRNKDYEFGCKRLYYTQNNYQFSFYAPFYIDDIEDLPEYFIINIDVTEYLRKTIKIYINKDDYTNYLKTYLKRYISNIDNRVIFCSPEFKQATYFGIDIKNGGLVKYIDNVIGDLYNTQNTINNFDNIICKGFERNNLIMSQIIPLSFTFNINDLFSDYEKKFFNMHEVNISGFYYNKFNVKEKFYDFSIDYYNYYHKYLKYDETQGKYVYDYSYENNNKINIMNVGYPSLNEGRFTKYRFSNKITPTYCRFKLLFSNDKTPYITNMSFAYSYLQHPNIKYGEFPTMNNNDGPLANIVNDSLIIPTGNNIYKYYVTSNYKKYKTLMDNYYSSWFNTLTTEDIFDDNNNWSDIINGYSYFNGILYKLSDNKISSDKFGVFINPSLNVINKENVINDITSVEYILSKEIIDNQSSLKMNNVSYNDDYIGEHIIDKYELKSNLYNNEHYTFDIYQSTFNSYDDEGNIRPCFSLGNYMNDNNTYISYDGTKYKDYISVKIDNGSLSYYSNIYTKTLTKSDYITTNKKIIKDIYGSYIIENNSNNRYYKYTDIINLINNINNKLSNFEFSSISLKLKEELNKIKITGYEQLPIYNCSNIFKPNSFNYKLIFDENDFRNIYDNIYIETSFSGTRVPFKSMSNIFKNYNNDMTFNIKVYIKDYFISEQDLFEYLINCDMYLNKVYWTNNEYNISYFKNLYSKNNEDKIINEITTNKKYVSYSNGDKYYIDKFDVDELLQKNIDLSTLYLLGYNYITKEDIINTINMAEEYLLNNYPGIFSFVERTTMMGLDPYVPQIYMDIEAKYESSENKATVTEDETIIYDFFSIYLNLFSKNSNKLNEIMTKTLSLMKYHVNLFELMMVSLDGLNRDNEGNKMYLLPNIYDNNSYICPISHYIYNDIMNLTSYCFNPYSLDNNIVSYNYFTKNKNDYDDNIYVDPYNLNKYISEYNKNTNDNIPLLDESSNNYKFKNFYYRILNNDHIKEYIEKLHNYNDYGIINEKDKNGYINILDHIYIKNRKYILNTSLTDIKIKDEYILLKTYLFENYGEYEYVKYLKMLHSIVIDAYIAIEDGIILTEGETYYTSNTGEGEFISDGTEVSDGTNYFKLTSEDLVINAYNDINQLFIDVICSKQRNSRDKFILSLNVNTQIELNLVFNKYFVQLNDYLTKLLKSNKTYLYLYTCNTTNNIDYDNWDYEITNLDNSIEYEKITSNFDLDNYNKETIKDYIKYLQSSEESFKIKDNYIERLKDINEYLTPLFRDIYINETDSTNIKNLFNFNNIKNNKYINNNNIYAKQINVNEYIRSYIEVNNLQNIVEESLNELNIEGGSIKDIESNEEYYRNIFIKEKLNISLYSLYNNNIISIDNNLSKCFSEELISKYHIIYNDEQKIYSAIDSKGIKYMFYIIDFRFDNTNNSFNLNNIQDISISFDKINNEGLSSNVVKKYFNLLNPFLNTNIFNSFFNLRINNIIKPNEFSMMVNYISSKIRPNDEYKFINLKESNNDIIYDNIIKYQKNKQLSMLRYFNFITPLLEEKNNILNNIWENLFIINDDKSQKYNVLTRNNIDIYKYNPLHICTKYDILKNNEVSYEEIYQYEYKHFNDNKFYNLKEEIIITLDNQITYDELTSIYETNEKTLEVFEKYVNNIFKKKLDLNIILFLYNKYNVQYLTESIQLNVSKTTKLYKISYKFNLK